MAAATTGCQSPQQDGLVMTTKKIEYQPAKMPEEADIAQQHNRHVCRRAWEVEPTEGIATINLLVTLPILF